MAPTVLPQTITTEAQLDALLSEPSPAALAALSTLDSDLLILGVGGKMGLTLARMAVRAISQLGLPYRVYGVARFSRPEAQSQLEAWGVEPVQADLLDRQALAMLPPSRNVIFMAGQKFGTQDNEARTWAVNTTLPAMVAEHLAAHDPQTRVVVFSTGNVYPLTPIAQGGAGETTPPAPQGEYAMSCLGRERVFEYVSQQTGLACAFMRLNYAIDLRYGVLLDIARQVYQGHPVDLSMGAANVIWQGDANAHALALLSHCRRPPAVFNITGPETVSIRWLAQEFGRHFNCPVQFVGQEAETALLSNAAQAQAHFGYPRVSLQQLITWTAAWVAADGPTLNKPTHFQTRDGAF